MCIVALRSFSNEKLKLVCTYEQFPDHQKLTNICGQPIPAGNSFYKLN